MNLHQIVAGAVGTVNPAIEVTIQYSTGATRLGDGTRIPSYAPPVTLSAQMQSLTYTDIAQLDGLNIQGERRALYINGNWEGLNRAEQRGGDLITFPDGSVWLVAMVLENWAFKDGWVKLALTRQLGGP